MYTDPHRSTRLQYRDWQRPHFLQCLCLTSFVVVVVVVMIVVVILHQKRICRATKNRGGEKSVVVRFQRQNNGKSRARLNTFLLLLRSAALAKVQQQLRQQSPLPVTSSFTSINSSSSCLSISTLPLVLPTWTVSTIIIQRRSILSFRLMDSPCFGTRRNDCCIILIGMLRFADTNPAQPTMRTPYQDQCPPSIPLQQQQHR